MKNCPACNAELIIPKGPKTGKVLILGDAPGRDELIQGVPFVGMTGRVLNTELARFGLDVRQFRVSNLWRHAKPKVGNKKEDKETYLKCFDQMVAQAIRVCKNKEAILLIGAETVKTFSGLQVSMVNGLRIEEYCTLISAPIIMACVQPTTVYKGGVGEIRFALEKFASAIEHLTE